MNMIFNRLGTAIVFAAALSAVLPASSNADVIYTYPGNVFDPTTVAAPYNITDKVTGYLDLLVALPNSLDTNVTPVAFSFTDDVSTITKLNAVASSFDITTGPPGAIVYCDIEIQDHQGMTIPHSGRLSDRMV